MNQPTKYALAIHGGAGVTPGRDYQRAIEHLTQLIAQGEQLLQQGAEAVEVVHVMVEALERSGLYVAGRGGFRNAAGDVELDAAIMQGTPKRAGCVASIRDIASPVSAARAVMESTPHVMLAGMGAQTFCREQGIESVDDPEHWYQMPVGVEAADLEKEGLSHGTVGAVALDQSGVLAASTSTAGIFGKRPGRVGDSPLIGAGTWADDTVAVSCTGIGEYFILAHVAAEISARIRLAGMSLAQSVNAALDEVAALGGDGGLIAVNADGEVYTAYNSSGLKQAYVSSGQPATIRIV